MEGGAVDALLFAGNDILRSIELRLSTISWCQAILLGRVIPDESRIEEVQEQRRAKCRSSRRWCPGPRIGVRAPPRAPL